MITSLLAILGGLFTGAILKKMGNRKLGVNVIYYTLKFWYLWTLIPAVLIGTFFLIQQDIHDWPQGTHSNWIAGSIVLGAVAVIFLGLGIIAGLTLLYNWAEKHKLGHKYG